MYLYHKYCCNKETRLFSWGRSNPLLNSEEKWLEENNGNDLQLKFTNLLIDFTILKDRVFKVIIYASDFCRKLVNQISFPYETNHCNVWIICWKNPT